MVLMKGRKSRGEGERGIERDRERDIDKQLKLELIQKKVYPILSDGLLH